MLQALLKSENRNLVVSSYHNLRAFYRNWLAMSPNNRSVPSNQYQIVRRLNMDTLKLILEEQQAISLVTLGILSLAVAFIFRRFPDPKAPNGISRQTFWLLQAILFSSGLAMVLWPSYGFVAALATTIGCIIVALQSS